MRHDYEAEANLGKCWRIFGIAIGTSGGGGGGDDDDDDEEESHTLPFSLDVAKALSDSFVSAGYSAGFRDNGVREEIGVGVQLGGAERTPPCGGEHDDCEG